MTRTAATCWLSVCLGLWGCQPDVPSEVPSSAPPSEDLHAKLFEQANTAVNAGDLASALTHYQAALQVEPNNPFEYLAAARIQERQADIKGAIATVRLGQQVYAANLDLGVREARLMAILGSTEPALSQLEAILAADSTHMDAGFAKVEVLMLAGQNSQAVDAATKIVALLPEEADVHLWMAKALAQNGKAEAAALEVQTGLELAGDCECTAEVRSSLTELGQTLGLETNLK